MTPSRLPIRLRELANLVDRAARPARPRRSRPGLEALETRQLLTSFVVTSAADAGPGTLRQAILDIDAEPASDADEIDFAIPGDGVQTIAPSTPLPTLDKPVDVDATTQPGYAGTPLVVLDGVNATPADGGAVVGLQMATNNDQGLGAAVRGLGIVRFSGSALQVDTFGTQVVGDDLGTDAAEDPGLGNGGYGVLFGTNGGNVVVDCLIENNGLRAIGGAGDAPGVPMQPGAYATTSNVTDRGNDTRATELVVSTTIGRTASLPTTFGGTRTVTYTVTNTGALDATDVVVALTQNGFGLDLAVTGATTTQGTVDTTDRDGAGGYPAFASLGTLAPGASATLTLTVQAGPEADLSQGFVELAAIATAPQVDYDPIVTAAAYDFYAVEPGAPPPVTPSLVVAAPIGGNVAYPGWGDTVTMTFTVTNTSPVDADGVTLSLGLDADDVAILRLLGVTTTQGTVAADPTFDDDRPQVAIGTLAPGASVTVTVTARVVDRDDPAAVAALAASGGAPPGDVVGATVAASDVTPEPGSATDRYIYTIADDSSGATPTGTPGDQGGGTSTTTGTGPVVVTDPTTGTGTPTGTGTTPENPATPSTPPVVAPIVAPIVPPVVDPAPASPVATAPVVTPAPVIPTATATTAAPVGPGVGLPAVATIPIGHCLGASVYHRLGHFAPVTTRHRHAATNHALLRHLVRVGQAHPAATSHVAKVHAATPHHALGHRVR